jgi:CrcB protein
VTALAWVGTLAAGGVGAVLRFLIDGAVGRRTGTAFPFGTLAVNLSGAVLLGLLSGLLLPADVALIVSTGAVGSYTTFSTWMLETQRLAEERQTRYAAANLLSSMVLGLAAAALGRWLVTGW